MSDSPHTWIHEVRARLESPPPSRLPPDDARKAAILVPLYVDAGELWTLLTKRSEELPHHKGQYAFPGGGQELGEDLWATAKRETQEEIGIEPKTILSLGQLDEASTPSGYSIVPCVGAIPWPTETTPNEGEIAEIFSVPLTALANPQLVEDREVKINGDTRMLRIYHVGRRQIWGLTARVIQNLLVRLGIESAGDVVH